MTRLRIQTYACAAVIAAVELVGAPSAARADGLLFGDALSDGVDLVVALPDKLSGWVGDIDLPLMPLSGCDGLGCPVDGDAATGYVEALVALDTLSHGVEVWRYPEPLPAGALLTAADGAWLTRVVEPTWAFVVDDAPGDFWSHPARLVTVGVYSGAARVTAVDDFPLLDGEVELFGDEESDSAAEVVLRWPADESEQIASLPDAVEPALEWPVLDPPLAPMCPEEPVEAPPCEDLLCANGPKRYALFLYGPPRSTGKWTAKNDKRDIENAIKYLGIDLPHYGFTLAGAYNLAKEQSKFRKAVAGLNKVLKCEDEVFVYYAGHGHRTLNADKKTYTHYLAGKKKGVTAAWLRDELKKLETCHLHVMIDACYSGGFVPVLDDIPGLESMYTSAAAGETAKTSAWTRIEDPTTGKMVVDKLYSGEKGGEYTSSVVQYLRTHHGSKYRNVATLLATAVRESADFDLARLAHLTHPQSYRRTKRCVCDDKGARFASLLDCPGFGDDDAEGEYAF